MVINIVIASLCFINNHVINNNFVIKNVNEQYYLSKYNNNILLDKSLDYTNTNTNINLKKNKHRTSIIYNSYKYIACDYDNNEKCFAYCPNENTDEYCTIIMKKTILDKIKIFFYIVIWFILSARYNITNKQRLNMLNLPWLQSVGSLGSGSLIALFFWKSKIRKPPKLNINAIKTYLPISFFHSMGHITAVISVSAGAVSFTQIVKAAEPIFTSGFNWILLGDKITLSIGLSLIPIVLGVSIASISELYFTWTSFIGAMISNVAFAGRNVASRLALDKPKGENITPENLFAILTIMSFIISIPLALFFEGHKFHSVWIQKTFPSKIILKKTFETGIYFYLYNEAAMIVLNNINPISHSIINTLKRVILLLTCVFFFNTPLTRNGIFGSLIAISGSYMYSRAKNNKKHIKN